MCCKRFEETYFGVTQSQIGCYKLECHQKLCQVQTDSLSLFHHLAEEPVDNLRTETASAITYLVDDSKNIC
jgi:hypothetical protein